MEAVRWRVMDRIMGEVLVVSRGCGAWTAGEVWGVGRG